MSLDNEMLKRQHASAGYCTSYNERDELTSVCSVVRGSEER